jgi:hypothetical protein
MDTAPKSLGRVDSQRVKEIRFASATIILGSVIIVLNIVCLFLDWTEIEFGAAPAAASSAQPPNQTRVASGDLNPFLYKSSDIKMKLSFGVLSEMSGSVSTFSGSSTFAANFKTQTQVPSFSPKPNSESLTFFTQLSGATLKKEFLSMCQEDEIPSTDILHTNTFAVWLHYSLCHVQPTVVMPALCISLSLTFISVLTWTLATWPLPLLDKAMPMWRISLGLALGRAVSLYKCAFISAAALGVSVGADIVFSLLVSSNYTVFLQKYAEEQSKKSGGAFAHTSSSALGYFVALITSGSTTATTRHPLSTPHIATWF